MELIIYTGGPGLERHISVLSAINVCKHLLQSRLVSKFFIVLIDNDEHRYLGQDHQAILNLEKYRDIQPLAPVAGSLLQLGQACHLGRNSLYTDQLVSNKITHLFPLVHGKLGEDGSLAAIANIYNLKLIGCNMLSSVLGMHKLLQRQVLTSGIIQASNQANHQGINQTSNQSIKRGLRYLNTIDHLYLTEMPTDISKHFEQVCLHFNTNQLFIKPTSEGSSFGVNLACNLEQYEKALNEAFGISSSILIEPRIEGTEIEVAVIGKDELYVSSYIKLLKFKGDNFYDYKNKYLSNNNLDIIISNNYFPAPLMQRITEVASAIYKQLYCDSFARIDMFVTHPGDYHSKSHHSRSHHSVENYLEYKLVFLEINTIPGFTPTSYFAAMFAADGLPLTALLDRIISLA